MKVAFLHADKEDEAELARAFIRGVRTCGDNGTVLLKLIEWEHTPPDVDVVCFIGAKTLPFWMAARKAGRRTIMIDRGYFRSADYFRISVDYHNPTAYVAQAKNTADRWNALGLTIAPWCETGSNVLLTGSSQKYQRWYGLPHPTVYAQSIADELARQGARVTYRPKVGWRHKTPVQGADYHARGNKNMGLRNWGIFDALKNANCLVTHGSNSCVEALLAGVPAVILGEGVTRGVSSTELSEWSNPRRADENDRLQLLSNLAWCQFRLDEFASGLAWRHLRKVLDA